MAEESMPLVVGIHIPYCIRKEPYSRQLQLTGTNAEKNAYMAALKRELLSWEGQLEGYEIPALHLFGPSATVMSPDLLGGLLKTAREILPLAQGAEISVDTHPLTVGTPALTGIAAGRPNRMELMMRSASDEELRALGCSHTMQHVKNAVLFFNRFHMNNFGLTVDLGIPGQTEHSWHNTLHACTIIHPAHIHVQTPSACEAEGAPGEETRFALYRQGCAFLKENGYQQYAAGDFCLPQHACRYTALALEGTPRLGLGLGAVSLLEGYLTRSTNRLATYLRYAGDYEKTTAEVFAAGPEYLIREYVSQRLRSPAGLSADAFAQRFGSELPDDLWGELSGRAEQGLLTETREGCVPTERGLFSLL